MLLPAADDEKPAQDKEPVDRKFAKRDGVERLGQQFAIAIAVLKLRRVRKHHQRCQQQADEVEVIVAIYDLNFFGIGLHSRILHRHPHRRWRRWAIPARP